jgi:hypothetical protein
VAQVKELEKSELKTRRTAIRKVPTTEATERLAAAAGESFTPNWMAAAERRGSNSRSQARYSMDA